MPEEKCSVGGSISDTGNFTNYNIYTITLVERLRYQIALQELLHYIVSLTRHESLATQVTVR